MHIQWIAVFFVIGNALVTADRTVRTMNGEIRGTTVQLRNGKEVEAFLGIPYAEPPVGKLRFGKPIPKAPWEGEYNAKVLPPPCYQNYTEKMHWTPDVDNMSEDCLFLNIWVPGLLEDAKLKPIFVFIHGGAWSLGSSTMYYYNGTMLASRGNIIVATINYRLGVFGFLTTSVPEAAGNMGIYDQILAVKWIKANAEAFGGDPDLLTIAGQSAGAMSASMFLVSPLTRGLVKRAVIESGGIVFPMFESTKRYMINIAEKLSRITGCSGNVVNGTSSPKMAVDCLKSLPPNLISEAEGSLVKANQVTALPHNDGVIFPRDPALLLAEGLFQDTEVLIGNNLDEGSLFLIMTQPQYFGKYGEDAPILKKSFTRNLIKNIFVQMDQPNPEDIAKFYVEGKGNRRTQDKTDDGVDYMKTALYDSIGDFIIFCPTMFQADYLSTKSKQVYYYLFTHRPNVTITAEWMGVVHFMEVPFVFGNARYDAYNITEVDKAISARMMDRWISFIKTGNPNIPGEEIWPAYKWYDPVYLEMGVEEKVETKPDSNRCEFWRDRYRANMDHFKAEAYINSAISSPKFKAPLVALMFCITFVWTTMQ